LCAETAIDVEAPEVDDDLPRIGQPAPPFTATTTAGEVRLTDYRGRWLLFISNPAVFKPIGTSELIAFSAIHGELQQRGFELLGLSIDSVYSHIAWLRSIEQHFGVQVPFPIVADLDRRIANLYRMTLKGEVKVEIPRWAFFIDPGGVVRAMIQYPVTCARNTAEILRVADALQVTEAYRLATPANWVPGDDTYLASASTAAVAAERAADPALGALDWYLVKERLGPPPPTSETPKS
jgi:peroxiredoxin (alkyl hydroperoxide reductase subunit C)